MGCTVLLTIPKRGSADDTVMAMSKGMILFYSGRRQRTDRRRMLESEDSLVKCIVWIAAGRMDKTEKPGGINTPPFRKQTLGRVSQG